MTTILTLIRQVIFAITIQFLGLLSSSSLVGRLSGAQRKRHQLSSKENIWRSHTFQRKRFGFSLSAISILILPDCQPKVLSSLSIHLIFPCTHISELYLIPD